MSNTKEVHSKPRLHVSLSTCYLEYGRHVAQLRRRRRVVRTRPRAIPLAMITMRKSTHGFPFVSHIWDAYGAPLGGPSGRRSSATKTGARLRSPSSIMAQKKTKIKATKPTAATN